MEIEVNGKKKPLLFDCGCGILQRIYESGYDHRDIDTIFLTHLHLDHVSDLLGLLKANWLVGLTQAQIYGPAGTVEWFGKLMELYPYLQGRLEVKITELTGGEVLTVARLHYPYRAQLPQCNYNWLQGGTCRQDRLFTPR